MLRAPEVPESLVKLIHCEVSSAALTSHVVSFLPFHWAERWGWNKNHH